LNARQRAAFSRDHGFSFPRRFHHSRILRHAWQLTLNTRPDARGQLYGRGRFLEYDKGEPKRPANRSET
jgi:hypothetical protein